MLTRIFFIFIFSFSSFCNAQSLVFKKDGEVKTFDKETYYQFVFVDNTNDCSYTSIDGTVQRILSDSLQLRAHRISMGEDYDFILGLDGKITEKDLSVKVSKYALTAFIASKNKKAYKKQNRRETLSGVLILTGLITLANSYDLKDKSFRKTVLISSGAQLSIGSLIFILNKEKKYKMDDGWHF